MTKQELKDKIESQGVKVKSIRKSGDSFKVKVGWRDYPKVRELISDEVEIIF